MKRLGQSLVLSTLAALLIPAAAHAQFGFFGGTSFRYSTLPYGYGSPYGYGANPYGYGSQFGYGVNPYGYGYGTGYGGYPMYNGYVTGPQYFQTPAYVPPIVYSVSTASVAAASPRVRQAAYPAIEYRATPVEGTRARIDVRVPTEGAEMWFDGVLMKQSGVERRFVTPDLEPGYTYTMEVRARWRDAAGKEQTRMQRIDVRAGALQSVDFLAVP